MYLPLPVLAALGIVFLVLLFLLLRRRSGDRDLIAPPSARPELPRARSGGAAAGVHLPPEVESEVHALLRAGNKIEAIKRVREATHVGLAEAKQWVERM